jgi:hypothetical protein
MNQSDDEFRVGMPVICQVPNGVELVGVILERGATTRADHESVFFGPHDGGRASAAIVPRSWLRPFIGQMDTPQAIFKALGL